MIAASTICKNEELLIAPTIESILDQVEYHIVVDTGSEDKTLDIIHELFLDEIQDKRLQIFSLPNTDHDMGSARNLALQVARELGMEYLLHVDADMIFYPDSVANIKNCMSSGLEYRYIFSHHYELYQYEAQNSSEWIDLFLNDPGFIQDRDMTIRGAPRTPFIARIGYLIKGAFAQGKWTDEAWSKGQAVEGVFHSPETTSQNCGVSDFTFAHYGWAKPVEHKIEKEFIWRRGKLGENPRVNTLHETDEAKFLVPFHKHPPALAKTMPIVKQILDE
jgi:glycosyltransferase involved in cell wall biosynthesis